MTFLRLFLLQAFGAILFVHAHAQRVPEQGRWALDMDFHLAFSEIKYQYQIPSSGTSITFNGPYNAKGIQLGGMYVHGAFRVGVSAAAQHLFYWASEHVSRIPYSVCPTNQPCYIDTTVQTERGGERLPRFRLAFAPQIQWMPKVAPLLRIGLVAEPGFYYYPNDEFLPNSQTPDKFPIGFQPKLEAGVQILLQSGLDDAVMIKVMGIKSNFKPQGFLEGQDINAIESRHQAMRLAIGYSVGF